MAPLFYGTYYAADVSRKVFERYNGLYLMWMKRSDEWLLCSLRVRYILPIDGKPTIRCKLNIPTQKAVAGIQYWEYDGFLTQRFDKAAFWIFEKRLSADRYDHFYLITNSGHDYMQMNSDEEVTLTFGGTYLTTGQDQLRSIVTGPVVLQRHPETDVERMESMMHSAEMVRSLSPQENTLIEDRWDQFCKQL